MARRNKVELDDTLDSFVRKSPEADGFLEGLGQRIKPLPGDTLELKFNDGPCEDSVICTLVSSGETIPPKAEISLNDTYPKTVMEAIDDGVKKLIKSHVPS